MHVHSDISPVVFSGAYSQISDHRIAGSVNCLPWLDNERCVILPVVLCCIWELSSVLVLHMASDEVIPPIISINYVCSFFPPCAVLLITSLGPCSGTQTRQYYSFSQTLNLGICPLLVWFF